MSKTFVHLPGADCRAEVQEAEGQIRIVGYAATFNKPSHDLGGWREIIAPGAFDDVLNDDVRGLFNHDRNFILGRSKSGTLSLSVDNVGLRYEIMASDSQTVRDQVIEPIRRGDVDGSSFAFWLSSDGYSWGRDKDGTPVRTVTRLSRLLDVGPVVFPAYPDTEATARRDILAEAERALNAVNEAEQALANQAAQAHRERYLKTI